MKEVNIQFAIKQDTKRPCFSTSKIIKPRMIRTTDAVTMGELREHITEKLTNKKIVFFVISKVILTRCLNNYSLEI